MKKVRIIILCILFLAVATGSVLFINLGSWLDVSDPRPPHLDYIFTFAGEQARVNYSREIMKANPDAHWFLSDYKNGYARLLRKDGFDMERISQLTHAQTPFPKYRRFRDGSGRRRRCMAKRWQSDWFQARTT